MRVYVDSSALLKRVLAEPESAVLTAALVTHVLAGDALVCSSLGWIEVSRALRARSAGIADNRVNDWCDLALSGLLERPMNAEVVALARRLMPRVLRSLDAIHLASALLTDVDLIISYDQRLLDSAHHHGIAAASPAAPSAI